MVRHVADQWEELEGYYRLSWSATRERVRELLAKTGLEEACRSTGMNYPRTAYITGNAEISEDVSGFELPAIVKPARPLSGFKTRLVGSRAELQDLVDEFRADLPFLLQEYLPGNDRALRFVALYRKSGRTVASFTGRKLCSEPPAMGQTTAAEAVSDSPLLEMAESFFEYCEVNGPVSLEFKIDQAGTPWVIEPTVGRTDYWLDCCIANGVNFPVVEYMDGIGAEIPEMTQRASRVWLDAERDPVILFRMRKFVGFGRNGGGKLPRFTFWDWRDPLPFFIAMWRLAVMRVRRFIRRKAHIHMSTGTQTRPDRL